MTKCSICGREEIHPIYEIINVVYGGKVVGYLCTDCAKKAKLSDKIKDLEPSRDSTGDKTE